MESRLVAAGSNGAGVYDVPITLRPWPTVAALVVMVLVAASAGSYARDRLSASASHAGTARVVTSPPVAAPHLDTGAIVDRVRHKVTPDPLHRGALISSDPSYSATFGRTGITLRPTAAGASAPLGIAVTTVTHGGRSLVGKFGAWSSEGNVAARSLVQGVTERVTASKGAIEWDVVIAHRLPGSGPLVVDAALSGALGAPTRIMHAGRRAWQFRLADGSHVRLGEITIKDAAGAILGQFLPRVSGDRLSISVADSVLGRARYPLTIDPTVGPEVGAGSVPFIGTDSDIVWNGSEYLLVWANAGAETVYATRVSEAGAVLDPSAITVGSLGTFQVENGYEFVPPSVTWNGAHFLVVWEQLKINSITDVSDTSVGVRIDPSGAVVDSTPIAIAAGGGLHASSSAGSAGATFVVASDLVIAFIVGQTIEYTHQVRYTRVTDAGIVLDPAGIALSAVSAASPVDSPLHPSVAALTSTNVMVVWSEGSSVKGARVNGTSGAIINPAFTVSLGTLARADAVVAANNTGFLVAWTSLFGDFAISGTRVDASGAVLDGAGIGISVHTGNQSGPALIANGSSFLVTWTDDRNGTDDVYGTRVNVSGVVQDPAGLAIANGGGAQVQSSVAWSGTTFLVAYSAPTGDIEGVRLNSSAAVLAPVPLGLSTRNAIASESDPVVAWNGTNYLVVWVDARNGNSDIYGTLIDTSGRVLGSDSVPISVAGGEQVTPSVAWNGSAFLVAWDDARNGGHDIYGTEVSATGTVSSPTGVAYSTAAGDQTAPSVTANGSSFLVAWVDARSGVSFEDDIYATRISAGGLVQDPGGIKVSNEGSSAPNGPAVASDGTNYLVVFAENRGTGMSSDIYARRISASGAVLDAVSKPINATLNEQAHPAVAWGGSNYLVAWTNATPSFDIYGTRVTSAGVPLSATGTVISNATGNQSLPAVSYDGTWLVAWLDTRNSRNDVYASRVDANGVTSDSAGIPVENTAFDSGNPALAGGPSGKWGITYDRNVAYGAATVFQRTVAPK